MRKHLFGILLSVFSLLCVVAVGAVLCILWNFLAEYEASSTDHALTEYFACFASGDYDTAADSCGFEFTDCAPRKDYISYLKQEFGSDFSELRFAESGAGNEKTVRVFNGNTRLGNVRLIGYEKDGRRRWKTEACVELLPDFTVQAPSFVTVLLNGVPLSEGQLKESGIPISHYEGISDPNLRPTCKTYRCGGYLLFPEISAVTSDGYACEVQISEDRRDVIVTAVPTEEQRQEYTSLMTNFSQNYARYISRDGKREPVTDMMDPSTQFYRDLLGFVTYWYTAHSGYEFRNTEISELTRGDESTFCGKISFDHIIFYEGEELIYHTEYRLVFQNHSGRYLLVDFHVL